MVGCLCGLTFHAPITGSADGAVEQATALLGDARPESLRAANLGRTSYEIARKRWPRTPVMSHRPPGGPGSLTTGRKWTPPYVSCQEGHVGPVAVSRTVTRYP